MLKPQISEKLNGVIWRLEIDGITETIVLEIRNDSEKQVSFTSINLQSGKVNFKDLTTDERWLTGIETVHDGVLLLHNYQSESGPAHKALIAVNAETGETLWSNYVLAFNHLSTNGPVVYNTPILPKKLLLADIHTGSQVRAFNTVIDLSVETDILAPQLLPAEFINTDLLPVKPYGNIHYLEYNNFRIISLHTLSGDVLSQWLFIVDDTGIVYQDLLNAGIQKLQPEAFVLHKNWLICLKNKTELQVLEL
ncbi:hypothetical protein GCM10023149_01000 [Mucilaginibacter gynuensis]|uniref:DUF4905 domain-containing protein n=1 Tax=Mucilaginibacter gynuensis TaxID=1302236 RepID=A0ABP8FMV3_9SPHI